MAPHTSHKSSTTSSPPLPPPSSGEPSPSTSRTVSPSIPSLTPGGLFPSTSSSLHLSPSLSSSSSSLPSSSSLSSSSTMARAPPSEDSDTSPTGTTGPGVNGAGTATATPTQGSVELPRAPQSNDRAGCWTCRIRRKRCDLERLEGNSCRTCKRLTIECLGWGARRPDWMRNKQAVDEYKAQIKAQLTRKGLIRGQPRSSMQAAQAAAGGGPTGGGTSSTTTAAGGGSGTTRRRSARTGSGGTAAAAAARRSPNPGGLSVEVPGGFGMGGHNHDSMLPGIPSGSSTRLYPTDSSSSFSDNTSIDLNTSYFSSPPLQPTSSLPTLSPNLPFSNDEFNDLNTSRQSTSPHLTSFGSGGLNVGSSSLSGGLGHAMGGPSSGGYDYSTGASSTSPTDLHTTYHGPSTPTPQANDIGIPILSGQNSIQEGHVMYYFENTRRVHSMLSNNVVMNTTFDLIVQDPRGALTNAVCALANLHYTRLRVSQGLEAPDPNPEHSTAKYFYDEAYYQLANAKQMRGSYTETDVLAALHLVCYSQLSGGSTDWQTVLGVAFEWLAGTGLLNDDNPGITVGMMGVAGQLGVKCTMMIDILSSLTLMRPPKYFQLYQRLLSWTDTSLLLQPGGGMQMEMLSGCPDEAWLAIAEVSVLAFWKGTEERKGSLSFRELVRRGDDIERRLRSSVAAANVNSHSNVSNMGGFQNGSSGDLGMGMNMGMGMGMSMGMGMGQMQNTQYLSVEGVSDEVRRIISNIFRETALLYLHTVVNSPSPGVHEINTSVDSLVSMLRQLAPSEIDRTLVFPICLAGSMTDNSMHREFLKGRLQAQDETIGNILKTRYLMEGVWQRRDVSGDHVDWRKMMSDRAINLLLI